MQVLTSSRLLSFMGMHLFSLNALFIAQDFYAFPCLKYRTKYLIDSMGSTRLTVQSKQKLHPLNVMGLEVFSSV